ncbi:MAG: ABC transporter substrate-binding protein [Spirochaetia bacterium]|nr:MAG: ABC transporter substrate-binding protein [Spirochaetia bacterium]
MGKQTKIVIGVIIVVLVIGGIWYGVNQRPAEITFGVIAGTTGQYAPAGEAYLQGLKLAQEEWNNGHALKFNIIVEDDGFDAVKGLSAYQKLKSLNKVDAYAIVSSFTIDAIYDLIHKEGKPVALGFEQSKPAENDNIFQVLPAAKPIQFALGKKIKELGYSKPIAAVSNNTPVYQNFYDGFKDGFGTDVKKFDIGSDIGGIRSQALAIVDAKPDVVAFFMAPKDGALLVGELLKLTALKDRSYFVFDQSIQSGSRDYQEILGSDMSKINESLVAMSKNDFTADFINSFKTKYNEDPLFASDMGYNSFMLLANSYNSNAEKWIGNMKTIKFVGADGEVYFDNVGLRVPNVFFGKLIDGKVVI